MLVGVGEWGFRELPFEEHCRIAREFGFRHMELGIGGDFAGRLGHDMSAKDIKNIRDCLADYGLLARHVCLENDFTLENSDDYANMVEQTKQDIRLCSQLGATHVRLFSGFELAKRMTEERWKRMLGALAEADELCSELGMVIAIETHGRLTAAGDGFIHSHTTSTQWSSLQRLLGDLPERVGINFDPGNLKAVDPRPLTDYAGLFGNRITYCHLKDWKRTQDHWVACGVGDDDIDWKTLLDSMRYDGVYFIEYEPAHDVEDGIRRSLNHLKALYPDLILN
ncbi:sugar phosphate isomerase/epimerase family protein [Paenibacillus thalictri]|uniref:Sugar phosphate isomerase/epimerase n=1 Tax=Paenibacillus thalictri TaxID=2527873 RepID=A0A4Q9DRP5_9BACL|nr:sugar phosphate isomerase/epimerase [Paenibacillus thalictri]TBL76359.1 sugar phosphate isomerase/epimerase [Paenibacillus thalictri]